MQNESSISRQQLHGLVTWLQRVREDERTRVAHQLHDTVLQSLTVLRMDLDSIACPISDPPLDMSDRLRATLELIDETLRMVRQMGTELRPGILDLGLGYAIEWQGEAFQATSGVKCVVQISVEDGVLTPPLATEVFRILQETLSSVVPASRAGNVAITWKPDSGGAVLEVQTDGKGFDDSTAYSSIALELLAIRERASSIGAEFSIEHHLE